MGRLDHKVALITGAASGLGRVAAERFAAEGATVVVADLGDGTETVDVITAAGGTASAVTCDVADEDSVAAAVAHAVSTHGGLHVLYNNAGVSLGDDDGPENTSVATWDTTLKVNVTGLALCCKYGIPAMLKTVEAGGPGVGAGGASIINVASFVAHLGAATPQIAYTASKGAVLSMTREIAVIYARQGLRANALCPGPVLAAAGQVPVRRGEASASPRAHPDGPLRRGRRDRQRCAVPGLGRVVVHDRAVAARRRRHHRRLHDPRVTLPSDPLAQPLAQFFDHCTAN